DPIVLRRSIGYVIQEAGLLPHLTVAENVGIVPRLLGWDPSRREARTRVLLELVGLDPDRFAVALPRQLSGGERQRVGLARALATDPPILLMDEPFGALDPLTRRRLQLEFRSLNATLRKTVVLVTHDVQEAFLLATGSWCWRKGRCCKSERRKRFAKRRYRSWSRTSSGCCMRANGTIDRRAIAVGLVCVIAFGTPAAGTAGPDPPRAVIGAKKFT